MHSRRCTKEEGDTHPSKKMTVGITIHDLMVKKRLKGVGRWQLM